MKRNFIMAVSALALMMPVYAYAENVAVKEDKTTIGQDIKQGLDTADKALYRTAGEIEAFFVDDDADTKMSRIRIQKNMTAKYMIGKYILDSNGNNIAEIKDVIIARNGTADLIVVSDNGMLAIGDKVAAFDYDKVVTPRANGAVSVALSSAMIKNAADFSYDPQDWENAKIIPKGSVSATNLLEGDILNSAGVKTAKIENVYFPANGTTQIVVSFNTTLGMWGDIAVLNYDDMLMVRNKDGRLHFQLTEHQSAQFKHFKSSATN